MQNVNMTSLYKYTHEMQMLNASLTIKLKFHRKQLTAPHTHTHTHLILDARTMLEGTFTRNRPNSAALLDFAASAFPLVVSTSRHPKVTLEK